MKNFEQIESEIRSELTNRPYLGDNETEQFLTDIIGKQVINYDTKYENGCDFVEDDYVMKAGFMTTDNEYTIHIYYGDISNMISCVDVIHIPIKKNEEYIYLLVDEYICDAERMETLISVFSNKDSAKNKLQERFEWYKKETYISQFINDDGSLDEESIGDYDWDVDDDSVDIHIYENDTHLSLYIKKVEIKN